ncbi:unnamed protein product, partial [Hapterophycus canaliculatus]
QVLVDAAYETKRIRSMLAENMAARMSLESQRREEMIVYNRELREKATAQKVKVHARLRKSNEDLYKRRAAEAEKAAAERAKRAVELGLVAAVAVNGGKESGTAASASAAAAAATNGSASNGSRASSPAPGAAAGGGGADGAAAKAKGKGKKGKGKAGEEVVEGPAMMKTAEGTLLKVNPKIFEPDRGQV